MATPKQVRFHYRRLIHRQRKLMQAIWAACDAKVIDYDDFLLSPAQAADELNRRIDKSTHLARAEAFKLEVLKDA